MIKRKENWPILFNNHLLKTMNVPFRYGRHDCCYSVVKCIQAFTGINISKDFPKYKNEKEANDIVSKNGGLIDLIKKVAEEYEFQKINVKKATAGDIVILSFKKSIYTAGIVGLDGRYIYAAKKPKGWTKVPLTNALFAWRI